MDTVHLLALLARARRALHEDPAMTGLYLEDASRILHLASQAAQSRRELVPVQSRRPDPSTTGGLASWQVRKVTAHVEDRLQGNLLTDELAYVANLSPGHFCRAFKVSMGETPHAYVIRQRIRRAQVLMLETGQTLSEIASACGLTDQAHLTRLFKRLVGTTPLSWRRTWQGFAQEPERSLCAL